MSTKSVLRPAGATLEPRTVSLTDRIALRVGMALIIWSRRTRRVRPPVDPALVAELDRERIARETEWAMLGIGLRTWR
ncbi:MULTISPECIES: hypothetical protein [unclassified Curtobacterium]|uniref:hypothetical protein n=1 Tax=unclassified Curtobacterium TaxID=257496 RepID=UPI0038300D59